MGVNAHGASACSLSLARTGDCEAQKSQLLRALAVHDGWHGIYVNERRTHLFLHTVRCTVRGVYLE
jgi:hypothetical protein